MDLDYLKEILTSEGSHLPNLNAKITEIVNHTNTLKADVKNVIEKNSIEFTPLLKENESLKKKSDNLMKEMKEVEEQIDNEITNELQGCTEELKSLSTSYKELNLFLEILKELLEINMLVKEAREKMEAKDFFECSKLTLNVQELVKAKKEKLKSVEIFKVLSQEVVLTYQHLLHEISEIWKSCVKVTENKDPVEFNIEIDRKCYNDLSQILKASDVLEANVIEKKFSLALGDILEKVTLNKSKISSEVNEDKALLIIQIQNGNNKPHYLEVFDSIKLIIEFLNSHFNIEIRDGVNIVSKIGSYIANDFANNLIKNCISETIPTCTDDLEKYQVVIENTEAFEKTLQDAGFLLRDSSSLLLDYAKNVNVLFANKFCQSYLNKARIIMKKDLHDITESKKLVSVISVLPEKQRNTLRQKINIQNDVFSFSNCHISKQAEELETLAHSMMKEIERSSDLCAVRLFFTVRNIFEMYSAIVPLHHKKFLESLPHQVAIFHNNCMYLTHYLIHLATQYYEKIPCILKDHFKILLEQAVVLRSLGAETLEVCVTNQRNQLICILRDSGFATLNENPKLDPNSEKSIRQCIRQLQVLQKVWGDVLAGTVYNRAIGFLLDSILEELIILIISVEDISSKTADELVSSFTVILEKAPSLFSDSKEIYRLSKKWQKFNEFVLILKGSLADINDRWADGMGPLANEFTPEQVKHLIRALFQNSDKRANLLAKIK